MKVCTILETIIFPLRFIPIEILKTFEFAKNYVTVFVNVSEFQPKTVARKHYENIYFTNLKEYFNFFRNVLNFEKEWKQ